MKKVLLSAILFTFIGITLSAQTNSADKNDNKARIDKMANQLNLTTDQKVLFDDALTSSYTRRNDLKQKNYSDDVRKQKLAAIDQSENSKLNEILSSEQYKQFQQIKNDQNDNSPEKKKTIE